VLLARKFMKKFLHLVLNVLAFKSVMCLYLFTMTVLWFCNSDDCLVPEY
jgi:hypothetical protein